MPVEKMCGKRDGESFIPNPNELRHSHPQALTTPTRGQRGRRPHWTAQPPARWTAVGYPSRVCSSQGEALHRIAAAIDQLAADAQGSADPQELTTRVAGVWEMISDLDPELARRAQAYTANEGGAPSD
jgi:hypothetical protein